MNAWNKLRSYFNKEADEEDLTPEQKQRIKELESKIEGIRANAGREDKNAGEGDEDTNKGDKGDTSKAPGAEHQLPGWWEKNKDNNNTMYAMSDTGNTAAQLMYHPKQNEYTLKLSNGKFVKFRPNTKRGKIILERFAAHRSSFTNMQKYKAMQQQHYAQNKRSPRRPSAQSKAYTAYYNPERARRQYVQKQLSRGREVPTRYGEIKPVDEDNRKPGHGYGTVSSQVQRWYDTEAPNILYNYSSGSRFKKDNKGGYYEVGIDDTLGSKVIGAEEAWRINQNNLKIDNNNNNNSIKFSPELDTRHQYK